MSDAPVQINEARLGETTAMTPYEQVCSNVYRAIAPQMFAQKWYISHTTGKFTCAEIASDPDRPWVYTYMDPKLKCGWYWTKYKAFGEIPTECLGCWKVVVTPRKVTELVKLLDIQQRYFAVHKIPCKCGMDLRDHTPHRYGGYWYTRSQKQGEQRWRRVRELVDKYIGYHVPVILKRYCTEFEIEKGPSNKYVQPEWMPRVEAAAESMVDMDRWAKGYTNDQITQEKLRRWMRYAYKIGDLSVYELHEGKHFYPPLVTYHEEAEEQYNRDKYATKEKVR